MKNLIFMFSLIAVFLSSFAIGVYAQNSELDESINKRIQQADSLWTANEYDKAILKYEEFLKANPDEYEKVRIKLIKAYAYLGMFETAEARAKELYGIDSELRGEYCRLALIYTMQNRNELALEVVDEMLGISDLEKVFPGSPTCAMFFQTKAGDYEDAYKYIYKIVEKAEGDQKLFFLLYASYLEQQLGNKEKSQAILDRVSARVKELKESGLMKDLLNQPGGFRYYVHLAELKALHGEGDKALEYLERAFENGDRYYYWIKNVSPFFTKYEDNPRFKNLMEAMKIEIDRMRENVENKIYN